MLMAYGGPGALLHLPLSFCFPLSVSFEEEEETGILVVYNYTMPNKLPLYSMSWPKGQHGSLYIHKPANNLTMLLIWLLI